MSNYWEAFKRAAKATVGALGPGQYVAGDKKVICPHCQADEFARGEVQLNTAGMTFMDLDWANKSATTLACTRCGKIQWFLKEPQRLNG